MSINLTESDHNAMDEFLGFVLDQHASGAVSKEQAISALAHVLTAAAIDNHGEVMAWFRPEQFQRWAREVISI